MILLNCSNAGRIGKLIAKHLRIKSYDNIVKRFPDNEVNIKLGSDVKNKKVIIVQSLALKPDEHLIELLLTIRTVKRLKARKIVVVTPYMAYLRQDEQFNKNECISNKEIARLIDLSGANELIIADPHLHRIKSLKELFKIKTKKATATKDIADYIKNKIKPKNPLIIGPDAESYQWAEEVAKELRVESRIFNKKRSSATKVNVEVKGIYEGKDVIIVDDIVSTGWTMINPALKIKKKGARSIHCITTHGLFVENIDKLKQVFNTITSTNTVQTKFSKIDLSKTIAKLI